MAMVKVKAKKFGTTTAANTPGILHFNPEGSDPVAREREVDERDVQMLVDRGLIEAPKGFKKTVAASGADTSSDSDEIGHATIGKEGARKLKEDGVDDAEDGATGESTRLSVAHQDQGAPGGVDGSDGEIDNGIDDDDVDTPPVDGEGDRAAPKAASKPAAKAKG